MTGLMTNLATPAPLEDGDYFLFSQRVFQHFSKQLRLVGYLSPADRLHFPGTVSWGLINVESNRDRGSIFYICVHVTRNP